MTDQIVIAQDAAMEPFAYDALDSETRIVVQQKTTEIRERIDSWRRSTIEIGQRLREVKARLRHGQWGDWLEREFRWSDQTALNLINVAELADQTPKILEFEDRFAKSALTALAAPSTPPAARQAALELAEAGEKVTSSTAQQLIAQHKPPAPAPDDGAPHLPPDFAAAQARAKKIGLYISMNAGGRFTLTYETGVRAVAGTGLAWHQALDLLASLERKKQSPPTQTALPGVADQEIAAAPPVLTPRPAPLPPPLLTPLTPPAPVSGDDQALIQAAAMLLYCRKLVALAQKAWDEQAKPHLDAGNTPIVRLDEAQAEMAARLALTAPSMRAQAGMLTFGAQITMERWDDEAVQGDEEIVA